MTNPRLLSLSVALFLAVPVCARAQVRLTLGAGGGIAGGTEQTLSDGSAGMVVAGAVTTSSVPLFQVGAEVNYLRNGKKNAEFVTAIARVHVPLLPFFVKVGAGYGRANLHDGAGVAHGTTIQLGAGYSLGVPLASAGADLFANVYLAYGATRSAQMADAGLAIFFP